MFVVFKDLPDTARVWIYQSNRSFTSEEIIEIENQLKTFLAHWSAHGSGLESSFELRYNRFIIIAVNQEKHQASGCAIDEQVRFIQQLEKQYQVDLLDKMNVSYKQGEYIAYKNLSDFKKMAKERAVSANTIVFNNLVANKYEYEHFWEVPMAESWHSRFI